MSTLHLKRVLDGPFEPSNPVDRLVDFYRANGYVIVAQTSSLGGEDATITKLRRGKQGAGWWTSMMFELYTDLQLEQVEDALELRYQVDVSGQWLSSDDRQFFADEATAAEAHLRGSDVEPTDIRPRERQRVDSQRDTLRSLAWWGGLVAFVITVVTVLSVLELI